MTPALKKTSILPVLNYAQALETAIQEDDLVTMRRHERADRYLDSFRSCAVKVRDVLESQELNLFALAAQDDFPFPGGRRNHPGNAIVKLVIAGAAMFATLGLIAGLSGMYSLNIRAKTVGHGQHGTARWATKREIKKTYTHVRF